MVPTVPSPQGLKADLVPHFILGREEVISIGLYASVFCPHNALQHIYGQREDNCRVFLSSNGGQCLKIPELKSRRRFSDDHGGFFQSPGCIHFSLSCNDLQNGRRRDQTGENGRSHAAVFKLVYVCLRYTTSQGVCQNRFKEIDFQILSFL